MYNCDETALYWRIEPDKTLASGPVQGKKKSKDRATILITCNSTGDDKLPILLFISTKTSRPLRHIDKENYQSTIFGIAAHGCKCQSLITIYENLIVKCNKPIEIFFYSWTMLSHTLLKFEYWNTLSSSKYQRPITALRCRYNLELKVNV